MDPNGLLSKSERFGKIFDRYGMPVILLFALLWFWFGDWRLHDRKLDSVIAWTQRDLSFTYLDCLRKSQNERQERACERAFKGEITDPIEVRENKPR